MSVEASVWPRFDEITEQDENDAIRSTGNGIDDTISDIQTDLDPDERIFKRSLSDASISVSDARRQVRVKNDLGLPNPSSAVLIES